MTIADADLRLIVGLAALFIIAAVWIVVESER